MSTSSGTISARREVFNFLRPQVCSLPLVRIGGKSDGAYLLPRDFDGITDCFSPGVENRKNFEDELLQKHNIRSHLMDYSSQPDLLETPLVEGKQFFRSKWLGTVSSDDTMSLDDWVSADALDSSSDLVLQMDIEGAEYEVLKAVSDDTLERFRVISIEFHRLAKKMNVDQQLEGQLLPVVRKLEKLFVCVHAHANNCCRMIEVDGVAPRVPNVIELTLLRKDRFEDSGAMRVGRGKLPHASDIRKNIVSLPYVELDQGWSSAPSNRRATIRRVRNLVLDALDPRVPMKLSVVPLLDRIYHRVPPKLLKSLGRIGGKERSKQ